MFKTSAGHLLPGSGELLGQEVFAWQSREQTPEFLDDLIQVFLESLVFSAVPSPTGTFLTFLAGILG